MAVQIPEVQKLPLRLGFDFVVNSCTHTPAHTGASPADCVGEAVPET